MSDTLQIPGTLIVARKDQFSGNTIKVKVKIDGKEACSLGSGDAQIIHVASGIHTIGVSTILYSHAETFAIESGQELTLTVELPFFGGLKIITEQ